MPCSRCSMASELAVVAICCGAPTCVGLSCPNKGSAVLGGLNGSSLYVRFAVEGFSALSLL